MAIRYDEQYVKRPREELEYTPDQILELQKCMQSVNYFLKYVKIVNPDKGEIYFEPYEYQMELLEKFQKHRFNVGLCSRQSGKTTIVSAYVLWYAIFHPDKNIGIVSNKESSAKMILARLKRMYECLPFWLKPGVTEYSKTFTTFDNGTRIIISATSPDAFRGESMNLLCCDEFAFVPSVAAEDFWAANYPTISASKEAKIIIISTPNGLFNIFHRIWAQANAGLNTFVTTKVSYDRVPGRDEEWAKEQIKNLGMQKFNQEFAVKFIGSTNTVLNSETIKILLSSWKEPTHTDLQNRLRIWEKPEEGAAYVLGVDPAKGTGENWSTIQVFKMISLNPVKMDQVAVFEDNLTDVFEFTDIIDKTCIYYNGAYIMCENNGEGAAVIQRLWWDIENENLVNSGSKTASLGIRASRTTKPKAVLLMKKLIEDGSVKLVDKNTIQQLGSFIEEKNKFFGKDKPDDLVSALYWACYLLEMDILDESYGFIEKDEEDDAWGVLSDVEAEVDDWRWLTDTEVFG
jgi:hypothetical protein